MQCYSSIKFEGYQTEKEAELRSRYLCENDELLVQINFLNMNGSELNPLTEYKLRYFKCLFTLINRIENCLIFMVNYTPIRGG